MSEEGVYQFKVTVSSDVISSFCRYFITALTSVLSILEFHTFLTTRQGLTCIEKKTNVRNACYSFITVNNSLPPQKNHFPKPPLSRSGLGLFE